MPIENEDQITNLEGDGAAAAPAPAPATADAPAEGEFIATHDDGTLKDGQDKESLDNKAVAAFMQGVKEATPPPKPTDDEAAAGAAPAPAAAKPAAKTEAAAPAPAPAAAAPAAKDEAVEAEITDLKLKDKAAARFRELSSQVKEAAPYVETLKGLGIDSGEKLTNILQDAARGLEFEDAIHRVQASPEQFSSAMQIIGGMNSGDPVLLNACFDAMHQTLTELGQRLGREVGGGPDPLAQHPDLLKAVNEDMTMDRSHALEVAKARAIERTTRDHRQQQLTQQRQQEEQQQEMTKVQQRAMADIDDFSAEMEKNDPHFQHKLAVLTPMLPTITSSLPPSRWALEVTKAYMRIPAPAAAPAAARPRMTNVPTRGGGAVTATAGAGGDGMRAQPKSDLEAFMQGVRDATPNAR